ncbi:hypothetical protein C8R47DRAFT_1209924 [Mycena vitilis]|nr:hypothetical protein C8R47DRAFT_1209924 [Mycena vitilis]
MNSSAGSGVDVRMLYVLRASLLLLQHQIADGWSPGSRCTGHVTHAHIATETPNTGGIEIPQPMPALRSLCYLIDSSTVHSRVSSFPAPRRLPAETDGFGRHCELGGIVQCRDAGTPASPRFRHAYPDTLFVKLRAPQYLRTAAVSPNFHRRQSSHSPSSGTRFALVGAMRPSNSRLNAALQLCMRICMSVARCSSNGAIYSQVLFSFLLSS